MPDLYEFTSERCTGRARIDESDEHEGAGWLMVKGEGDVERRRASSRITQDARVFPLPALVHPDGNRPRKEHVLSVT